MGTPSPKSICTNPCAFQQIFGRICMYVCVCYHISRENVNSKFTIACEKVCGRVHTNSLCVISSYSLSRYKIGERRNFSMEWRRRKKNSNRMLRIITLEIVKLCCQSGGAWFMALDDTIYHLNTVAQGHWRYLSIPALSQLKLFYHSQLLRWQSDAVYGIFVKTQTNSAYF